MISTIANVEAIFVFVTNECELLVYTALSTLVAVYALAVDGYGRYDGASWLS